MTRTVYLPAAIGFLIGGTASVLQAGWTRTFIAAAVCAALLAALLLIRGLWLSNHQHHQVNHEELDDRPDEPDPDPDPFAERLIPWVDPPTTDTTGETR